MISVVIPTLGRPSLQRLLDALATDLTPEVDHVVVVDDRRRAADALDVVVPHGLRQLLRIHRGPARGPAAARNVGWRSTSSPWVAFIDDDVLPSPGWTQLLVNDLLGLDDAIGGSQGRIEVPLPDGRRPTDWERNTAGLAVAAWATADMAYRREALAAVGGFDERFRRAFREDADLALRVRRVGWALVRGSRVMTHPVRPADRWVSVRLQAGNADDALMRRRHGPDWHRRAEAPRGRLRRHVATTASIAAASAAVGAGRARMAAVTAGLWLAGSAEFAWARVAPGPRNAGEVATMVVTSAVIPPVAVWHAARGLWQHRHVPPWRPLVKAVLFDRDGTLVRDVPYNGDPALVELMPGAHAAVGRLRDAGLRLGVVSNQSGVGRGLLRLQNVRAVNVRVEALVGRFDTWQVCPHDETAECECRKPRPALILRAAAALGVDPAECVVIGDIGSDVQAARAAGARAVLVPTPATRPDEVGAADTVAGSLSEAVDLILQGSFR